MTHYLALDQAPLRVGYALGSHDSKPEWGVFKPSHRHVQASLRDWLQSMVKLRGIQKVIYEAPFIGSRTNPQNLISLCGLPAIIRLVCDDCDVPCIEAPIDSWRLHFIGFRRAPKELRGQNRRRQWLKDACMRSCVERDWFVTVHDEADALGILDWALSKDFPEYGSTSAEIFRPLRGEAA